MTHFLGDMLSRGVADAGAIRGEPSRQITLRRGDAERLVPRDSILTFADLMEQAEAAGIGVEDPAGQRTLRRIVGAFYHPTIVPDADAHQRAARAAPRQRGLRQVQRARGRADRRRGADGHRGDAGQAGRPWGRSSSGGAPAALDARRVGALLYNAIVLGAFWLLMVFYRRETLRASSARWPSSARSSRWSC